MKDIDYRCINLLLIVPNVVRLISLLVSQTKWHIRDTGKSSGMSRMHSTPISTNSSTALAWIRGRYPTWSSGRGVARVEELAGDGVGAVRSGSKVGSLGLVENTEERPQPEGEIVLQFFNAAGQIPDPEELPHVDGAALKDVTPVDVRQTRRRHVYPAARKHAILDSHAFKMKGVFFQVSTGFDLDQP